MHLVVFGFSELNIVHIFIIIYLIMTFIFYDYD